MEAATAESAAKTAAMESAAEAPTGISRGRRKGTERGYRGEGNHRFTKHDNLLHNDVRGHKRCRRRIVAPRRAQRELNTARSGTMAGVTYQGRASRDAHRSCPQHTTRAKAPADGRKRPQLVPGITSH